MSASDLVEPKGIVVPYVGIERVIELASIIYKHGSKEKALAELATLLGCTRSNLNNVTPTLGLLGLAEVKQGTLSLTSDGLEFAEYCISDPERAKQIVKKNVPKAESLMFVKSLLETRSSISGDDIGRAIADRFKKSWKDIRTYRNFGNSCASILAFSGTGYFNDGVLSLKPPTIKATQTFYTPAMGFNPMMELLTALHGFERTKIEDLLKKTGANEAATHSQLTVCTILRLAERETSSTYRITDLGRQLIDPTTSTEDKTALFRKILLSSPYAAIIQKLSDTRKQLTYGDIGDIMAFFLKSTWATETKLAFAKKFVTWLNAAGLAEKIKPGTYKVIYGNGSLISIGVNSGESSEKNQFDANSLYEIGRALGSLEAVIADGDRSAFFADRLVFLKDLLSSHEDLKLALDMLAKNFEIATSTSSPALYKQNLDFVRERIKEKVVKVKS